jgi:hypothetical protein
MLAESEPEMMFSFAFFQQPLSGTFHQQKITSALSDVVFSHLFNFFGVEFDFLLTE